ncbi:MAG: TIGR00266 family protein [Candidatus Woesearchaeota archaeon]
MEYKIQHRPSYAMLVVTLDKGEVITAEAGAMTYMDPSVQVETTKRKKGFLENLGMALLGRQSFFVNHYTGPGEIALVAAPVGDIDVLKVSPKKGMIIQKNSFIASNGPIDLDIQWEGFTKGLFGQGLFMIKATGEGQLFINTFGALEKKTLAKGQTLIVDNFHLVAFSDTCKYEVKSLSGIKQLLFSGEGLLTHITGPGEIYIQTKNLREFVTWLWTLLEPRVRMVTERAR